MDRYKIIRKGIFQKLSAFEEELNGLSAEGWRVVDATASDGHMYVILERQR